MPFEAVLAILIVFVAFPAVLFRGVARVRAARPSGKSGLRASDLRAIVQDAVEEATAPLHDRIDTLEGLLMGDPEAARTAAGRIDAALLDDAEDHSSERYRATRQRTA